MPIDADWCRFIPIDSDSGTPGAPACYMEVTNPRRLTETLETFLEEYNAESKKPMDLVLFMFATEHVTRIARIMSMPSGNALLVGMGGSGRQVRVQYFPFFYLFTFCFVATTTKILDWLNDFNFLNDNFLGTLCFQHYLIHSWSLDFFSLSTQSLTRLAAFVLDFGIKQIELSKNYGETEWRDDIRAAIKTAGLTSRQQVFLFADTQIKLDSFVEDINNLLNSGEVPNIFSDAAERAEVIEGIRKYAREDGHKDLNAAQLYNYL